MFPSPLLPTSYFLLPIPGHPLHPMTVHFPIAFYCLGVLLTLLYLWRGRADYEQFSYWSFILSWLGALFASLIGLIDQSQLELSDPRRNNVNSHITAGVALIILNGLLVYMRFRWADVLTRRRWLYLGLMALGLIAILATAWLGAELVYRWRVGVL
ncbi:MAG TPA: DUF2231 domain-containing protein [Anaerolineae bacterium]|nr:DUF2231 domain-containing protein [Anaerolineae bacterium]HXV97674.1 DUF2231 domain-containing protein [Anaerolineae bacterium]